MTRAEALKLAKEMVDEMSVAPTNARGYTVDGHKAPTLHERTSAVLNLAAFLLEPGDDE